MKKIALILMAIMVTLTTDAQRLLNGTIPSLKGEGKINLKIDFSETKIDNKSILYQLSPLVFLKKAITRMNATYWTRMAMLL